MLEHDIVILVGLLLFNTALAYLHEIILILFWDRQGFDWVVCSWGVPYICVY